MIEINLSSSPIQYEQSDQHTERFKSYFDEWIDVTRLSNEAMAEQIYGDGIDILIDMVVHSKGSRLPAFAMRPSPIQVFCAWMRIHIGAQ